MVRLAGYGFHSPPIMGSSHADLSLSVHVTTPMDGGVSASKQPSTLPFFLTLAEESPLADGPPRAFKGTNDGQSNARHDLTKRMLS